MKILDILAVSYYFYPFRGQASYWRTQTLRRLAESGHRVTVLRVGKDPSLTADLDDSASFPKSLRIIEAPGFNLSFLVEQTAASRRKIGTRQTCGDSEGFPGRGSIQQTLKSWLRGLWIACLFPDHRNVWLVSSVIKGTARFAKKRPDVIYAICNPRSNIIAGWLLSLLLRRPLVIEYKDAWTVDEHIMNHQPQIMVLLARKLEKKALERASALIGVTEKLIEGYQRSFQEASDDKWELITHGYEAEEFEPRLKPLRTFSPPLRLLYAATRLSNMSYKVDNLIRAVELVNEKERKVHLTCIGKAGKAIAFARSLGLADQDVEFIDLMPKSFVIDKYQDSDVLVMLLDNTPWNKAKYTSKIFDLLASRRPILACVSTDSLAAKLIRSLKVGIVVENENPKAIADAILDLYRQHEEGSVAKIYDLDTKLQFERGRLVDKLEACLMNAMSQPHS